MPASTLTLTVRADEVRVGDMVLSFVGSSVTFLSSPTVTDSRPSGNPAYVDLYVRDAFTPWVSIPVGDQVVVERPVPAAEEPFTPLVLVLSEDVDGAVSYQVTCSAHPSFAPGVNHPDDFLYRAGCLDHALSQGEDHLADDHASSALEFYFRLPRSARLALTPARWS